MVAAVTPRLKVIFSRDFSWAMIFPGGVSSEFFSVSGPK